MKERRKGVERRREKESCFFFSFPLFCSPLLFLQHNNTVNFTLSCLVLFLRRFFFRSREVQNMSSSRVTGPLLGRLAAAAGAAMRGSNSGALRAIVVVESSSTPSTLFAGLQRRPHATSSWIKVREGDGSPCCPPLSRLTEWRARESARGRTQKKK